MRPPRPWFVLNEISNVTSCPPSWTTSYPVDCDDDADDDNGDDGNESNNENEKEEVDRKTYDLWEFLKKQAFEF